MDARFLIAARAHRFGINHQVTPTARTPEEAVEFLDGLGSGIRASVVLDADGRLAAGSAGDPPRARRLGELAGELFARAEDGGGDVQGLEVSTTGGAVFAVRRGGWSVAVVAGRLALSSLMMFDLHRVTVDLEAAGAR